MPKIQRKKLQKMSREQAMYQDLLRLQRDIDLIIKQYIPDAPPVTKEVFVDDKGNVTEFSFKAKGNRRAPSKNNSR